MREDMGRREVGAERSWRCDPNQRATCVCVCVYVCVCVLCVCVCVCVLCVYVCVHVHVGMWQRNSKQAHQEQVDVKHVKKQVLCSAYWTTTTHMGIVACEYHY